MEEYTFQSTPDKTVREQLDIMFSRHNWVGIKNPLKEKFSWPVALEQNEIISMNQAEPMVEQDMARKQEGTFLPLDGSVKNPTRLVRVVLKPGETRMVIGEAAYVVVPQLFNTLVRERYGTKKEGLARLRNPHTQKELLKEIIVGPMINNVGEAVQTYVNDRMKDIEGFSDVQVNAPKGFADPEVRAKAQATRNANKTAETQPAGQQSS